MRHLPLLAALLLAAPAAAEDACLVPGPAADGVGCAGAYKKVSEGFVEGTKAWEAWVAQASAQVKTAAEKVEKTEAAIQEGESQVTKLKLDRSKEAKAKLKELDKANKALWEELEAARREQDAVCRALSKSAAAKLKELTADLSRRLQDSQKSAQ